MQRSCGSAGQPANHSAESSSVLNPAYLGYDDDATGDDDDASDEISDVSSCDGHTENADNESPSSVGQPASKKAELPLNQFETPLGLDPTSTPDFVQHVASFKAQLDLVQDAVKKMRSAQQPTDTSNAQRPADAAAAQPAESSNATAQAAAEEECFRAVVDLREVAQKLDKHQFQDKAKLLENVDKAMFVTAGAFATYLILWCVGRGLRPGSGSRALARQRLQRRQRRPDLSETILLALSGTI